jgi:hypothetical protein
MLTGELRGKVDALWNAFWTGGISNPIEVIEQITYLLFLRRLDQLQAAEEAKATQLKKPIARRYFPDGKTDKKVAYEDLRWSRFKNLEARAMYDIVSDHVFPWLRAMNGEASAYDGPGVTDTRRAPRLGSSRARARRSSARVPASWLLGGCTESNIPCAAYSGLIATY